MTGPRSAAALLVSALLLAAAGYEAAIALDWARIGKVPGAGAPHEGVVLLVGLVAAVAGAIVLLLAPVRAAAAIPLAACALMIARFYSFDPYYAPLLRRMSDGGLVAPGWVYALTALSIVCAAALVLRPRAASVPATSAVMLCAATAFVAAAGH